MKSESIAVAPYTMAWLTGRSVIRLAHITSEAWQSNPGRYNVSTVGETGEAITTHAVG